MFNRMYQQKQKIQNKTKRIAFNQEGHITFSKPCLLILQWVNAYFSVYDISMEVALVFSGAKDAISLTITKLNIDMHHVKTVFFFQAFGFQDNGRSNGSKPRQAARKCRLKVQKPGCKSKIKISMWQPVVSM